MLKILYCWTIEINYQEIENFLNQFTDCFLLIVDNTPLSEEKEKWLNDKGFDSIYYGRKNNPQKRFYYQVPSHWCIYRRWDFLYKKLKELGRDKLIHI